jgi:predicted small lipoprotein YifL
MRHIVTYCLLVAVTVMLSACGAKRPVLYPNAYLKEMGPAQADQEIDDCIKLATEYKAGGDKAEEIAKDTGKAGVVGAATGAVIGAITGNWAQGAAIGGAGAATATMGSGIMRSDEPDPVFKQFVDQCLREKGFQPIGWH